VRSCRPLLGVDGPLVGVDGRAQRTRGVVEARTGRADRDRQHVGDLGQRQAVEVLEDEDRPLVGRQPAETTFQLVAIGDAPEGIRFVPADRVGVCLVGEQADDLPAAPLATRVRNAGPDDDPVRPGVEASGSRNLGSSSQMVTSVCCRASSARWWSRRIR
jgi:hypothetical protein